jgi:hypothetical protein
MTGKLSGNGFEEILDIEERVLAGTEPLIEMAPESKHLARTPKSPAL